MVNKSEGIIDPQKISNEEQSLSTADQYRERRYTRQGRFIPTLCGKKLWGNYLPFHNDFWFLAVYCTVPDNIHPEFFGMYNLVITVNSKNTGWRQNNCICPYTVWTKIVYASEAIMQVCLHVIENCQDLHSAMPFIYLPKLQTDRCSGIVKKTLAIAWQLLRI